MKPAKLILIKVKYINCNNLIVCIAIISNLYSSGSLVPYLLGHTDSIGSFGSIKTKCLIVVINTNGNGC